jgi:hypothetical protein
MKQRDRGQPRLTYHKTEFAAHPPPRGRADSPNEQEGRRPLRTFYSPGVKAISGNLQAISFRNNGCISSDGHPVLTGWPHRLYDAEQHEILDAAQYRLR